jgi:hypothetical protein
MSEIIKNFNDILNSFLIQLSPIIGDAYHKNLERVCKYNVLLPIEQFLCHALPLREKIINKDESYFYNDEKYIDKIDKINEKNDEEILGEILRLKNIYSKLDNESKKNIWDILNALLILGEEYVEKKYMKK